MENYTYIVLFENHINSPELWKTFVTLFHFPYMMNAHTLRVGSTPTNTIDFSSHTWKCSEIKKQK